MATSVKMATGGEGLKPYYKAKIEELEILVRDKSQNLKRLEAQRNDLNGKVRALREELMLLQEPGSYVGEVIKVMGKKKVLVKVHPEGKYVVEVDKDIDITTLKAGMRVALRNDSYQLHFVLPTKVRMWCTSSNKHPPTFRVLEVVIPSVSFVSMLSFIVWYLFPHVYIASSTGKVRHNVSSRYRLSLAPPPPCRRIPWWRS